MEQRGCRWMDFFLNFVFDYFLEIYRANSSLNIICLITMISNERHDILYVTGINKAEPYAVHENDAKIAVSLKALKTFLNLD
jgi:hypothetical protein